MRLFDLAGRVALVTGAAHGLGMAMAKGLGKAGARLVVNGHSSQSRLDSDFVNGQILYVDGGILATIGRPINE